MFDELEVVISRQELEKRVSELGREVTAAYADKSLTLLCVLKGSFVFTADLARHIDLPLRCDFLGLSSYGAATESSGVVAITKDLNEPVAGRHVLVVEDIVDTGLTMQYLRQNLATRNPASIRIASLLSKPSRRRVEVDIDFLGFTIEDRFVVGYGMDFEERYRNLPYIGALG